MEFPEELSIGRLRGPQKALAEEIIGEIPKEYAVLINERTPILSLVRLSKMLDKSRKMRKKTMEKMDVLMCSQKLQYEQTQKEVKAPKERTVIWKRFPRGTLEEGPLMAAKGAAKTVKNRELRLVDFVGYSGNDREVRKLAHATEAADKFMEMKRPGEKKNFDSKDARDLYRYLFPNKDEAESWSGAIVPRLKEMAHLESSASLQKKYGESRFHAIVATSKKDVVGYTQFSTMPLEDGNVVVFWQYGGLADKAFMQKQYGRNENFREEGVGSAFYVFRHGIAADDAARMGRKGVAGTILEAEFIGQADNDSDIRFTKTRLHIHRQMGAKAIMLEMEDGSLLTAHMQPRLSPTSNPILLHMCFRPLRFSEEEGKKTTVMDKELAKSLVMSYIDNFDREGFAPKDVQDARQILLDRFAKAKRVVLLPPENLPNIVELARMDPLLKKQVVNDYGSMEAQEAKIRKALEAGEKPARRLGS